MSRDYKKEWEKEKETKITRLIKIDKEIYLKFRYKLECENKTLNGYINEQILKYINEKEG